MSADDTRPVPVADATVVLPAVAEPNDLRVEASWCAHCGHVVINTVRGWIHVDQWLATCDPAAVEAKRFLDRELAGGQP